MPMLKLVPTLIADDIPATIAFCHDVLESELADDPYGMREFTVRDRNGVVAAFGRRIGEAHP